MLVDGVFSVSSHGMSIPNRPQSYRAVAPHMALFYLPYLFIYFTCEYGHTQRYWGLELQHVNLRETQFSPVYLNPSIPATFLLSSESQEAPEGSFATWLLESFRDTGRLEEWRIVLPFLLVSSSVVPLWLSSQDTSVGSKSTWQLIPGLRKLPLLCAPQLCGGQGVSLSVPGLPDCPMSGVSALS